MGKEKEEKEKEKEKEEEEEALIKSPWTQNIRCKTVWEYLHIYVNLLYIFVRCRVPRKIYKASSCGGDKRFVKRYLECAVHNHISILARLGTDHHRLHLQARIAQHSIVAALNELLQ